MIVETKLGEENTSDDQDNGKGPDGKPKEVVFKYPKSKIFVGGLDFKVNNEELK